MPKSQSILEKHISKIENLADKKAEELEIAQFLKYHGLYEIVVNELRKHKVLMYGGMALNELMPDDLKFYKSFSLPDIDVFSTRPLEIVKKLVEKYRKHGHLSSYTEALHEGTYKVFADGLHVLDITQISRKEYRVLSQNKSIGKLGIPIANIDFLRYTLHSFLAQPNEAHRWAKVFQRLLFFYETFPVEKCSKTTFKEIKPKNVFPPSLVDEIFELIKTYGYVMFGGNAVSKFLFKKDIPNLSWPSNTLFDVLVDGEPDKIAKMMVDLLKDKDVTVSGLYTDVFTPDHVIVKYKRYPLLGIYKTNSCVSYVEDDGVKYANIQTMCKVYLELLFSKEAHHSKKHIRCILNMLSLLQLQLMKNPGKHGKMFETLVLQCIGPFEGVFTLKRKQIERRLVK